MTDLDGIPDALRQLYQEECSEALMELAKRIRAGDAPKGTLRVFKADGTHEDICWGHESEEEKQSMLAMIERQISGGASH